MNLKKSIGLNSNTSSATDERLVRYLNLKLALLGCPTVEISGDGEFENITSALLQHHQETDRILANYLSPADHRIQNFIYDYLQEEVAPIKMPSRTLVLDYHGLARTLSLPPNRDSFSSDIVSSFRVKQGVLHNPQSDRRTTEGIFHIAEGGLPIPADKIAVPKKVFGNLLKRAFSPPKELMQLPFTSAQTEKAECFVSLLLRPVVCPEVPNFTSEKSLEIRFFAPGNLVSNLDFVESIFGNAGDPYLPENDSGLDAEHWTGHSGCVILAPHLIRVTKKDAGLPGWDSATEKQRESGMCWKSESELYNNGKAFKLCARDKTGVIVTMIADNYFGYCKKEVKTQISFSANLFGLCEEEHAGGALVFPSYDLGEEFSGFLHVARLEHNYEEMIAAYPDVMDARPEGYAVDKQFPDIIYVSENVCFDLHKQTVSWPHGDKEQQIKLLPGKTYVRPSGYKIHMGKASGSDAWRLIGTVAEGTLCHKPCTVSGGGKSEISKPITDAILQGPVFVADFKKDFDWVTRLINRNYENRFRGRKKTDSRLILSHERSLGSVIKLLTPASREYTAEYNSWLEGIPQHIKELVFVVKRFYKPEWGDNWREHFSVDVINGTLGNELKYENRKLVSNYLRVGFDDDSLWRTFGLRKDFHPAFKLSREDDITASVVVPASALQHLNEKESNPSVKFVHNCEYRLFQRPDDAIHRGYDKQTEADFTKPGNFFSNYEPLSIEQAQAMIEDSIGFGDFTEPMQDLIRGMVEQKDSTWFVSSAHPRMIDGKPSKNPRYLQTRSDLLNPRDRYLVEMATRLYRRIPIAQSVPLPVNVVVPGRRNNPPSADGKVRSLAVYNPIHYMELPELFMEFISSLTGKSPSTTGAGSEGALTKGPFNALPAIIDLNNALVGYLLTGHDGFVTAAGYVGPNARMDHDISLLIPEVWCRMSSEERSAAFLIRNGYLEKCEDMDHDGKKIPSSRLGYRITPRFVRTYFGRVFSHPHMVFTDEVLKPETQDMAIFADGMANIISTHQKVAKNYFEDGSIAMACPPLRALLHIMAEDQFEGKDLSHPEIRALFTRENLVASDWYAERLRAKQAIDIQLWKRHASSLEKFLAKPNYAQEAKRLGISERLSNATKTLDEVRSPAYLEKLLGSLGAQPL